MLQGSNHLKTPQILIGPFSAGLCDGAAVGRDERRSRDTDDRQRGSPLQMQEVQVECSFRVAVSDSVWGDMDHSPSDGVSQPPHQAVKYLM